MPDIGAILRDPIWVFIGVAIPVVLAVASFMRRRERRGLTYETISNKDVITSDDLTAAGGHLKVLIHDQPLDWQPLRAIEMRFTNAGNVPMLATDFAQPIRMTYVSPRIILSARAVDTFPQPFHIEVSIEQASVCVQPVLLNPGAGMTVRMLVTGLGDPTVTANIRDTKVSLAETAAARVLRRVTIHSLLLGIVMIVALLGVMTWSPKGIQSNMGWVYGPLWLLYATALFVAARQARP